MSQLFIILDSCVALRAPSFLGGTPPPPAPTGGLNSGKFFEYLTQNIFFIIGGLRPQRPLRGDVKKKIWLIFFGGGDPPFPPPPQHPLPEAAVAPSWEFLAKKKKF